MDTNPIKNSSLMNDKQRLKQYARLLKQVKFLIKTKWLNLHLNEIIRLKKGKRFN